MAGTKVLNDRGELQVTLASGDGLYHPRLGLGIICETQARHYQLIMVDGRHANRLNDRRPVSYSKLNTKGGFTKLVEAGPHAKPSEWVQSEITYMNEV